MKTLNLVRVLTIAACLLFFSTKSYAYGKYYETVSHDTSEDEGGSGWKDPYAFDLNKAETWAKVCIEDGDTITWASAEAYQNRKVYITDYWPNDPTLTATASNLCEAEADAKWDTENSEYLIVAECDGYATGCGLSLYSYAQAVVIYTDTSDTDSGYFEDTADMSFTGATIYFGHSADADAYGYDTSDFLYIEGTSNSETTVVVDES